MNKLSVVPHVNEALLMKDNVFNLYVVGESANSMLALRNLIKFCKSHYPNNYQIHLIDALLSPEQAWICGVRATPLLVRILPTPTIKIIGNLSDTDILNQVLNSHGE